MVSSQPKNESIIEVEMYEKQIEDLKKTIEDLKKLKAENTILEEPVEQGQDEIQENDEEIKNDQSLIINNVTIISRTEDNYINATQLCQAGEKKFNDWYRSDSTKVLIDTLSFNTEIPVLDLVEAKKGKHGGSWIHPDLGIQLAHSSSEWMDKNLIFYRKSGNKNKTTKGKKERN